MELGKIVNASHVFGILSGAQYASFGTLHRVYKFKKKIDENVTFYNEQERVIVEKYADKNENGTVKVQMPEGRISFSEPSAFQSYNEEITKLRETDIPDIEPLKLSESDFKVMPEITPDTLVALEDVVEFEETKEN